MMYFVQHLQTYAAKNHACQELRDYVEHYENVLVKDEISLDAIKEELRLKVNQINAAHPKLKPIRFSSGNIGDGIFRMDASTDKMGCPDTIFIMDICKVRSIYQFSENNTLQLKGGDHE